MISFFLAGYLDMIFFSAGHLDRVKSGGLRGCRLQLHRHISWLGAGEDTFPGLQDLIFRLFIKVVLKTSLGNKSHDHFCHMTLQYISPSPYVSCAKVDHLQSLLSPSRAPPLATLDSHLVPPQSDISFPSPINRVKRPREKSPSASASEDEIGSKRLR